jgi:hypothetical protein
MTLSLSPPFWFLSYRSFRLCFRIVALVAQHLQPVRLDEQPLDPLARRGRVERAARDDMIDAYLLASEPAMTRRALRFHSLTSARLVEFACRRSNYIRPHWRRSPLSPQCGSDFAPELRLGFASA